MTDEFDADDRPVGTSPWPIFVALGIVLSEVGVLLGIRPVTVGGLLLLVGAAAGALHEAGYVSRPERAVGIGGVALVVIGLAFVAVDQTGTTVRGRSIVVAGALSLVVVPLWLAYSRVS